MKLTEKILNRIYRRVGPGKYEPILGGEVRTIPNAKNKASVVLTEDMSRLLEKNEYREFKKIYDHEKKYAEILGPVEYETACRILDPTSYTLAELIGSLRADELLSEDYPMELRESVKKIRSYNLKKESYYLRFKYCSRDSRAVDFLRALLSSNLVQQRDHYRISGQPRSVLQSEVIRLNKFYNGFLSVIDTKEREEKKE